MTDPAPRRIDAQRLEDLIDRLDSDGLPPTTDRDTNESRNPDDPW